MTINITVVRRLFTSRKSLRIAAHEAQVAELTDLVRMHGNHLCDLERQADDLESDLGDKVDHHDFEKLQDSVETLEGEDYASQDDLDDLEEEVVELKQRVRDLEKEAK